MDFPPPGNPRNASQTRAPETLSWSLEVFAPVSIICLAERSACSLGRGGAGGRAWGGMAHSMRSTRPVRQVHTTAFKLKDGVFPDEGFTM
eukprot:2368214-Lingulodinium_polyedra.AAC.1